MTRDEYFRNECIRQDHLRDEALHSEVELWKNVLLLQSSLFGIVISLHDGTKYMPYTRLVFYLSCILLLYGILASGIVLYRYLKMADRLMQAHRRELKAAQKENRVLKNVDEGVPDSLHRIEKITLFLLFFALVTLFSYAILKDLGL